MMVSPLLGQTHPGATAKKATDVSASADAGGTTDIPVSVLKFEKSSSTPEVDATGAWAVPVPCNSDGTLFLSLLAPFDPSKPTARPQFSYLSAGVKEVRTFSMSAISDLHDATVINLFPSDSIVGFLVNATKESQLTPSSRTGADGQVTSTMVNRGKRHSYIAIFGLDGAYKESIELPMDYQIFALPYWDLASS